jgi:hypothetical protein
MGHGSWPGDMNVVYLDKVGVCYGGRNVNRIYREGQTPQTVFCEETSVVVAKSDAGYGATCNVIDFT